MAEIPDRVPGGVILASYANDIRDRAVMRYVDATARQASDPLPVDGQLSYLQSDDELYIHANGAWRILTQKEYVDALDAALQARVAVLEAKAWSTFDPDGRSLTFNGNQFAAVDAPVTGDYLATMQGLLELKPDTDGQNHAADVFLRVAGVKQEEWAIYVRPDTITAVDLDSRIPFMVQYPLFGVAAGVEVDLWVELNTTVDGTAQIFNTMIGVEQIIGHPGIQP